MTYISLYSSAYRRFILLFDILCVDFLRQAFVFYLSIGCDHKYLKHFSLLKIFNFDGLDFFLNHRVLLRIAICLGQGRLDSVVLQKMANQHCLKTIGFVRPTQADHQALKCYGLSCLSIFELVGRARSFFFLIQSTGNRKIKPRIIRT